MQMPIHSSGTLIPLGVNIGVSPVIGYDYFESRTPWVPYRIEQNYNVNVWFETDSRKALSAEAYLGTWHRPFDNARFFFSGIEPSYRISDKWNIQYELGLDIGFRTRGYVTKTYDANDNLDEIIFGTRDQKTIENTVNLQYTINNRMGFNLRMRHYWSTVDYTKFYSLNDDGTLSDTDYENVDENGHLNDNRNFNAFNIDMVYTWQIAPGSFVNAIWKDAIYTNSNVVEQDFGRNFMDTMQSPHFNTFSLKVIYFLDIAYFKKGKKA